MEGEEYVGHSGGGVFRGERAEGRDFHHGGGLVHALQIGRGGVDALSDGLGVRGGERRGGYVEIHTLLLTHRNEQVAITEYRAEVPVPELLPSCSCRFG